MRVVHRVSQLLVLLASVPAYAHPPHHAPPPDTIYFNGRIEVLDDDFTRAKALAVTGGRISAVGSNGDVLRLAGRHTRRVNLHHRALMPGFVDAHAHIFNAFADQGLTIEEAQDLALAQGITTMGVPSGSPPLIDLMVSFAADGKLFIRTSLYLRYDTSCGFIVGDWYLAYPPNRDPEAMLRIPGIKIFSDGGACNLPATSFEFSGDPPRDPPLGNLYFEQAEIDAVVAQADEHGYQAVIHAVGDRGRDIAMIAIDHTLAGRANVLRHRIDHDSFMRPDQVAYYASVGIQPVVLTSNTCTIAADLPDQVPAFVLPWFHPWGDMVAAGLDPAWHSDWPFRTIETFGFHLYNLSTLQEVAEDGVSICEPESWQAHQALTVRQALRAMTLASAYALHMEEAVGSLEVGKLADLIVVSKDPIRVDPDEIKDLTVLATIVGGVPRWCAPDSKRLCPTD